MIRLVGIFCFLLLGYGVTAQHVVGKSSEIVVIRGESYYMHTVEEGQTLYSICKAYGVDVETVKRLNDKKDNTLSLFDVLKIPYTTPVEKQDPAYFYYTVEKGETLSSISRKFEIKVKRILQENERYDNKSGLPVGAVLRLPKKDINMTVAKNVGGKAPAAVVVPTTPKVEKKTLENESNPTKNLPAPEVHPEKTRPDTMHAQVITVPAVEGVVRVALLLPFYAKERNTYKLSPKSEQFVYFYEGILMAVDSLKNRGYQIDLRVYDTERSVEKSSHIVRELNTLNPDLIIGPVYNSVFKTVIANLHNRNIPIIYPLSSQKEDFDCYPNFVQVNASTQTLVGRMADWVVAKSHTANIINIRLAGGCEGNQTQGAATEKKMFADKLKGLSSVHYFNWDFMGEPIADFSNILSTDKENVIILPTNDEALVSKILPALSAYAGSHRITVLGLPKWQTFTTVDHDSYYKLNVKIFTYSFIDCYTEQSKQFSELYRRYFYTEPNPLANKSFDMGLYFIELAAKYKGHILNAIEDSYHEGLFSTFRFSKSGEGLENKGFRIVTYGSDYQVKVESLD